MSQEPKILFWDIETSLQLAAIFQLGNNDWIDPSSLVTERYIICASWKWAHEDKVHAISVTDNKKAFDKDPHNDLHVVEKLHEVLSEADVIVHHNGDSFDKRYVDTRILHHGLPALPPITSIDTYKVAKSKLLFNSNKLDYIGKFLGVGKKMPTTSGLWMKILNGDAKAHKEMVKYNKHDVVLLEKVYQKLIPYMQNHVNREIYGGIGCPRCGSKKIQSRGFHRAITKTYRRFCCQKCFGWFRDLKGTKETTKSRVL
jgi:hypothetical protein